MVKLFFSSDQMERVNDLPDEYIWMLSLQDV